VIHRDSTGRQTSESAATMTAARPFASHPYGPRIFSTACTAIGVAARNRRR
jgi:hypothetical protein